LKQALVSITNQITDCSQIKNKHLSNIADAAAAEINLRHNLKLTNKI
jgi:hypothetical protein